MLIFSPPQYIHLKVVISEQLKETLGQIPALYE